MMRNILLLSGLSGFGYSLPHAAPVGAYQLTKSYTADNFLDSFEFYEGKDKFGSGNAQYLSKDNAQSAGLAKIQDGKVYLGADSTNVVGDANAGRPSIRLTSVDAWNGGLLVADFEHFPAKGCGMWPAFWTLHENAEPWVYNEIDIVEATSLATKNAVTVFTQETCEMADQGSSPAPGSPIRTSCGGILPEDVQSGTSGKGCTVESAPGTFGESSNDQGAGVWAMQVDGAQMRAWYFPRAQVPADLQERGTPNPDGWANPIMNFAATNCDLKSAFTNMNIIININFCGGYTTSGWQGYADGTYNNCAASTGYGAGDSSGAQAPYCEAFVREHPEAFTETYFLINSVRMFERS
ncbi:hypothetical protein N0V90_002917 [Kalmusia sp. IMI 367209]|nr:hypothetical protein N0V90_002917 [Kalmusia sp. IMI 367209]